MKVIHILICGLCAALATPAAAKWKVEKDIDKMTDQISYFIVTTGKPYDVSEYVKNIPELVIRITPTGFTASGTPAAKQEVLIDINPDAINRAGTTATVRFGKNKAQPWILNPSTDRHAAFPVEPVRFLTLLKKSPTLLIRFETSLGAIRTLEFQTDGLSDAIKSVRDKIVKPTP